MLDEIDSGLDIDAMRDVASAVNGLKRPDSATLMVTHYKACLSSPGLHLHVCHACIHGVWGYVTLPTQPAHLVLPYDVIRACVGARDTEQRHNGA